MSGVRSNIASYQKFQELLKKKEEMKLELDYDNDKRRRKRKRRRPEGTGNLSNSTNEQEEKTESDMTKRENHWNELQQYFGCNDRFEPPACSRPPEKTSLEEDIDKAIAEGDLNKAEELSDSLATRDLAVKIDKAVKCRDFIKEKEAAEASQKARQKKQLAWGFEAKKRWETKSNMGYM
ncbi:protein FAM204A [Protopterus annectens]|uniref:protein FAM204A n=1 Tax=Protopterus annectens TaxID=7888 RepID=UPI001CFA7612|nr:protein FAM204A [Protopterus annectens]